MKKLLLVGAALLALIVLAPPLPAQGVIAKPHLFPYHIAVGNLATVDQFNTITALNLYDDYTGSNNTQAIYGEQIWAKFNGTVPTSGQLYGLSVAADNNSANATGTVFGGYFDGHSTGSAVLGEVDGLQGTAVNYGSGAITWMDGVLAYVQNFGTSTVTNGTALWVGGPIMSQTAPITNAKGIQLGGPSCQSGTCSPTIATGLYIADWTFNATNNFAIDANGGFRVAPAGNWMNVTEVAFASLPAARPVGALANVSDSNTNVWGATVAAGGTNHVLARWNGTVWTVVGK